MKRKLKEEAQFEIIKALSRRIGEGYHLSEMVPLRNLLVETLDSFTKEPLTADGAVAVGNQ